MRVRIEWLVESLFERHLTKLVLEAEPHGAGRMEFTDLDGWGIDLQPADPDSMMIGYRDAQVLYVKVWMPGNRALPFLCLPIGRDNRLGETDTDGWFEARFGTEVERHASL